MQLSKLYINFIDSEKTSGILLLIFTALSLAISNSFLSNSYINSWHTIVANKPIYFWINDVLMTLFFLMVGLEIEREVYIGELSNLKKASLPIMAAIGGMVIPAIIHGYLNSNTIYQSGFAIPMATDIAFSLAILSLLGNKVPLSLKIFLTALAIIDDLGAIVIIATCYSNNLNQYYLLFTVAIFVMLLILNKLKVYVLWPYLLLGSAMWYCIFKAGIHPTITGVLVAFSIPFQQGQQGSISYKLQHFLHKPVAFVVMPLFALANTAIILPHANFAALINLNTVGIALGLIIGKPLGIFMFSMLGVYLKIASLPKGVSKINLWFVGCLAGIGFTMSIFISLLAFNNESLIIQSKIAIIAGSLLSGIIGYIGLIKSVSHNNTKL